MEIYRYNLSPETISNITDRVIEKATEWQNRPLEETRTAYIIISIDMDRGGREFKILAKYL
jgi:transposase-like protein